MKPKLFIKIFIAVLVMICFAGCMDVGKEKRINVVEQKTQREVSSGNQSLNQTEDWSYEYEIDGEVVKVEPAVGRVEVHFKSETPENIAKSIIVDNGGEVVEKNPVIDLYTVKVLPGNEISFRDKMRSNPHVDYAELDFVASTSNK